ncbi:MAG TPA: sodium:alanine symporter family protein, partial [Corynebacterium glutamicum]|nr:sodium:alanine symporter family protein [Corynebacterium glutamicum]
AIIPLSGVAVKLLKNYTIQKKAGLDPVFHRDMMPEVRNIACWNGKDAATSNYHEAMEVIKKN